MSSSAISPKIAALRELMLQNKIDAWIIPSTDPHKSEYMTAHWETREWISGFDGSAGTVVITKDHAGLWTDVRYFLQAEQQLAGTEMELHRMKMQTAAEHLEWISLTLPSGSVLGIDGNLFGPSELAQMEKIMTPAGINISYKLDLIPLVWKDRPELPLDPIFEHDAKYSGKTRAEKLDIVRKLMLARQADYHLINTLDNIAWLYNLRGRDVECNPVFIAYTVISKNDATLFIDERKVPADVRSNLAKDGIAIKPYTDIDSFLAALPANSSVWIDPAVTSLKHADLLNGHTMILADTATKKLKAIKNPVEIAHLRKCMEKDGIALIKAFRWLEQSLAEGQTPTESEFAGQLMHCRSLQAGYFGESFYPIVGYNSNGAIIHYRPADEGSAQIKPEGVLLVDSGGQYTDGTTDITRTIQLGNASAEVKTAYTLVLKGHISLAKAVFIAGTNGMQLDILARQHLWQHNMNYGHGTGHGVGFFLNVHEPPQGFVAVLGERGTTAHEVGMLTSNEPGYYANGSFGIRIENLVVGAEAGDSEYGQFLKFETVTLFPIDTTLIDMNLMDQGDIAWLNAYHQEVFERLAPQISQEEYSWLKEKCQSI